MKKKIFLACLASVVFFAGVGAEPTIAKWQTEPVVIDGNTSDWGQNIRFFHSESKIQYEVRNDAQNLYVIMKTTDETMRKQMATAGMKLKFKLKTNPKITATIEFPGMKMDGMMMAPPMMGGDDDMSMGTQPQNENNTFSQRGRGGRQQKAGNDKQQKPEMIMKDSILVDGFQFTDNVVNEDAQNPEMIRYAKSKGSKDQTVYEICIPLREFFGAGFKPEIVSAVPFQLQIVVNAASQSSSGGMRSRGGMMGGPGGGGPGGDMGGGPGGGGPGGEMGGGQGGMSGGPDGEMGDQVSMNKKTINLEFKLSPKQ